MRKKRRPTDKELVIANDLGLHDWLSLLGTEKWANVFPNNCFPTDKHKAEYLLQIKNLGERAIKALARSFLNKSINYGVDRGHLGWVIENYTGDAIIRDDFEREFDRRSLPKNGPQWEGITWVLDLLPKNPLDAIAAIRAYVRAHLQYFTDQMIYGHNDVVDMIQARYSVVAGCSCFISYGGPDELFAKKLYESLTHCGIQAFFFPVDATPGKSLYKVMREGVNQYDRIILICSSASLNRPGVLNELTETLRREAREGGKDFLIPVRLDDYVFTGWSPDETHLAHAVRERVIADFSGAIDNEMKFHTALQGLIVALRQPLKK